MKRWVFTVASLSQFTSEGFRFSGQSSWAEIVALLMLCNTGMILNAKFCYWCCCIAVWIYWYCSVVWTGHVRARPWHVHKPSEFTSAKRPSLPAFPRPRVDATYFLPRIASLSKEEAHGARLCYTDMVRVLDTIRIGYADTHFFKKHWYGDTARIINNYT